MTTRALALYGNHRGGSALMHRISSQMAEHYNPQWIFSDPKENRAVELAKLTHDRFSWLDPRSLRMTALEALPHTGEDDDLLLAMDTIGDIRQTLAARGAHHRACWQIVGRTPGGVMGMRLGLQGCLLPGDRVAEQDTLLLLDALDRVTQDASSRELTMADPFTALALAPLREASVERSLQHLAVKERDPGALTGGALRLLMGRQTYPLVPVVAPGHPAWSQVKEAALEEARRVLSTRREPDESGRRYVQVAVLEGSRPVVHLVMVEGRPGDQRRVEQVHTLEPLPAERPTVQRAVFTD